jgi:hypothetical protein
MQRLMMVGSVLALLATSPAWAQSSATTEDGRYTVYFALDSASLDADARRIVETAAADFQRTGSAQIDVRGHTDTSGDAGYNERLSERRAEVVAEELTRLGVPSSTISTTGVGQTDLAVQTGDGVREAANRRVEIQVAQPTPAPAEAPATVTTAAAEPPPVAEPPNRGLFSLGAFYGYNMLDQGDNDGLDSSDNNDKTSHLGGANLSFDYAMLDWLSLGLEQAVFYNFGTDDDGVGGRSAAGFDFVLARGSVVPYIGANIGYLYGKGIEDDAFAGPEIGIALGFLNAKVAYDMPFNRSADEGIIATTIGLGIKF